MLERKFEDGRYLYFLLAMENGRIKYSGWYSIRQLARFPECVLNSTTAVQSRVNHALKTKSKHDIWDLITIPKREQRKDGWTKKYRAISDNPNIVISEIIAEMSDDAQRYLAIMAMWPVGQYAHTIR